MKLSREVLLEIVDIVRDGLLNSKDISERLRELDLELGFENGREDVYLSEAYKKKYPRDGGLV